MESLLVHGPDMKMIEELLLLPSAILYGSRALGVHTNDSDYDIAIQVQNLPERFREYLTSGRILNYYLNVTPRDGGCKIFRITGYAGWDLLVFEDVLQYLTFKSAVKAVNNMDLCTQRDKDSRCRLFEEQLIKKEDG